MSNMSITYTVKITIINSITNESVIFNKAFISDLTVDSDNLLYDNNHVLHDSVYVLDLFTQEVSDYCSASEVTISDIIIDEYELYTDTERVEVYFENSEEPETFTLSPSIKCYIYPKEEPLRIPELIGTAYDSNTIVWTWPNDEDYAHYLITEPLDESEDSTSQKIIATIPIGAKQYIETGLEPDTPYSRRLINFTATQTSLPSAQATVTTETVNPTYNLSEYFINREQDWTITDEEREFIQEHLEAFHSGVGDLNDCKVYKQSEDDFYEKFKGYFILYGTYTKREKRWEQVSFKYKIKLEALETIEEQEGDVTFKLDAYPWQEVYLNEYLWTTHPVNVYAKLFASIQVFKLTDNTYEDSITGSYEYNQSVTVHHPLVVVIVVDVSSSMRAIVNGSSIGQQGSTQRMDYAKIGAKSCVDILEGLGDSKPDGYIITVFADSASSQYASTGSEAKNLIDSIYCGQSTFSNGGMPGHEVGNNTNWLDGMNDCKGSVWDDAFAAANGGKKPDYKSMVFITDGSPNKPNGVGVPSNYTSLSKNGLDYLYSIIICTRNNDVVTTSDPDTSESSTFVTNAVNYLESISNDSTETNDGTGISNAFAQAARKMTTFTLNRPTTGTITATAEVPVTTVNTKIIDLETELLKFTFDGINTPVRFNPITKRAEIYQMLTNTKMPLDSDGSIKTVKQLLEEALERELAKPENEGYTTGNVKDGNGNIIGKVWKNIHIKDTYAYADEDGNLITNLNFNNNWQYGNMGSVNTFTNAGGVATVDNTDDDYIVTDNSFVWINGYTEAIIFDGVRYGHANVCAYYKCLPETTMFYRNDVPDILKNRIIETILYRNVIDINNFDNYVNSTKINKEVFLYQTPDPNYTQLINDGLDKDMIVKIEQCFESPVLTYRFNLLDPDAYTPYLEILNTCNPQSTDKNCIVITIYKANNVCVNPTISNNNYIASFDYENPVQNPLLYEYGLNSTWNINSSIYECDGQYINQYIHFFAMPMTKTQPYYDQLPPEGQDLYYGQVNGRYRENNPTGKQDFIVDVPQFDIPTTVLATHSDSIKIYLIIEEASPNNALVEYKWHNESPIGSGYTQTNGDYVTFTSDFITMKDIEYKDVISTMQTENMELFNQDPYETIKQLNRPTSILEQDLIKEYNYDSMIEYQTNCNRYQTNGIEITTNGLLSGPYEDFKTGRYKLTLTGLGLLNAQITMSDKDNNNIEYETEILEDINIIIKFNLYERHDDVCINISNTNTDSVFITEYTLGKISGYYEHYYIEASTNNGDVIVSKCPYEIIFDDNNQYDLPVTYQGIINATSKWAPRIHNGYYYFNQHENYLYSEFDVEANFAQETITNYETDTLFIIFNIDLWKDGGETEDYSLNKDTRAELLQNETHFKWVDKSEDNLLEYGLTLKPTVEGFEYSHYDAYTWESPVLGFTNTLTTAGPIIINYRNTDGSNTGLEFKVRSYDVENACWPDWSEAVNFENGTIPNVSLSSGYQIQCLLSATEQHEVYEWDKYLSCYLDWIDYLDETASYNINTATDHISVGPINTSGRAISQILDFACGTGIDLSMYTSNSEVAMQVAYSNTRNDLLLENIQWQNVNIANTNMSYRYWRFKIEIPYRQKVYWVHIGVKTLKSSIVLPYIQSISMTGSYEPEDIETSFQNLESFEVPLDGEPHEIITRINNYIESDIVSKGFTVNDIKKLDITTTNENAYLIFDDDLLLDNPDPLLLETSISAAFDISKIDIMTNTLYIILNEDNKIIINGIPQQYCPITVETIDGTSLKEIYNASQSDMKLYEKYIMTEENNYITIKRTDIDLDTLKVWINDDEVEFELINHLIMFKNNYMPNDEISISYNILNSFMAIIDTDNNQTTIIPYENNEIWNNETEKQYKVMFETSVVNNKMKTDLSMNPTYRTEYSGFIYMTYEHNIPYSINIFCNPRRLKSGGLDTVDISIEVLDVIKNPIIGKEVFVDCLSGGIEYINNITDENGVVHLIYRSCYNACTDTITAKVLLDDETNLENFIQITNY